MDKRKDQQILVKIACVIVSFVLWLYIANTENPEINKKFSVPVTIMNQELLANSKLAIIPESEYNVQVKVKGPILAVNRLSESDFDAKADLSLYALKKGKYRVPVTVKLKNLSNNISVMEQGNLWVEISLDDYVEKSVPVKADIKVDAKTGFKAFQQIIKPNSVYICGAAQYVNSVSYVMAKGGKQSTDKNVEMNLPLEAYDDTDGIVKEVVIKPDTVNVVVPIRKTKNVSIKVKTTGNIKSDMKLISVVTDPATISISGEDNLLNSINSIDTEPIDLSTISGNKTITPKLIIPTGITLATDNQNVNVKITVDNIVTQNYSIDIKFSGLDGKYNSSADKTKVSVVLKGTQSDISALKVDDIKCSTDLSKLTEGEGQVVPVKIQVPEGITIVSSNPESVKVNITVKVTNNPANTGTVNTNNPTNNANTTTQ